MPAHTIYVATDFSPASERAFELALETARQRGGNLVIGHAIPAAGVLGSGLGESSDAIDLRIREETRLETLRRAAEQAGVPARTELLDGPPADVLSEAAENARATLMVVGVHGRRLLSRRAPGGVAARLVCMAPCPVLTVREDTAG